MPSVRLGLGPDPERIYSGLQKIIGAGVKRVCSPLHFDARHIPTNSMVFAFAFVGFGEVELQAPGLRSLVYY